MAESGNAEDRKLVLLVEDDGAHASMLYQILKQETPYHVYYTADGHTAWNFLQHVRPHLLLLDYRLPRLNGLELYDRVRAHKELHNIPVLMVSAALPEQEARQRGVAYLKKPFELDQLLNTVNRLIESSC
ncbi:response regulator [Ktedonosporobacter rubrisoli]|uniref:Response regulator n=1 Tax=Ktedonosporobacter rubrisoli TaxID=2509675 RepID=A0A4P6JWY4_KTERU|nr:response regulator [Ktedonosporobacter rubrisoli]QBD79995.1 response regulator [Ktedonosporobacter rubrisoli]